MYRPWAGRKVGVEMEMNQITVDRQPIARQAIVTAIKTAILNEGIAARMGTQTGYFHSDGATWDVKTDSSAGASEGEQGWEVASPALILDAMGESRELKAVCAALTTLRPQVNRKCGLHVHVDCSDLSWREIRNLVVLWARYEPFFFELTPESRRSNGYCPPYRKTRWTDTNAYHWGIVNNAIEADSEHGFNQYARSFPRGSLNMAHWFRSKRVEFRLAAGTINYEKIIRWTQLLCALVVRVKSTTLPMIQSGCYSDKGFSTGYVFKALGLSATRGMPAEEVAPEAKVLLEWAETRRKQFQNRQAEDGVSAAASAGRSVRR